MRWQRAIVVGAVVASTLAFDPGLADISNLPRAFCWATGLAVALLCAVGKPRVTAPFPLQFSTVCMAAFVVWQYLSIAWAVTRAEALWSATRWALAAATVMTTYRLVLLRPVHGVVLLARVSAALAVAVLLPAVWQAASLPDFSWANRYAVVSIFTHKGTFAMLLVLLAVFPAMRLGLRLRRGKWFYRLLLVLLGLVEIFLQARAVLLALVVAGSCWLLMTGLRRITHGQRTILHSSRPFRDAATSQQCRWHLPCLRLPQRILIPATVVRTLLAACIIVGGAVAISKGPVEVNQDLGGARSLVSLSERRGLWRLTLRMAEEKPIIGWGAGNWKVCHPAMSVREVFSMDVLDFRFVRPHNEYLSILSETGVIGLLLFLLSCVGLSTCTLFGVCQRGRRGSLAASGLTALCAIAVFAFFDFPFERTELLLWTSVVAGVTAALYSNGDTPLPSVRAARCRGVFVAIPLLAALLIGFRWHSERCLGDVMNGIHTMQWELVERRAHEAQTPFANLAPDGVPYAYYEAMAYEYQHKPALATFRKALHDSPYDKQVLNDVARLMYTENHQTDSAITLLQQAVHISPHYSRSYFNLAQIYLSEGREREASDVLHSLDLEAKRQRIERNVWHYLSVQDATYYFESLLPAEQRLRKRLLQTIENRGTVQKKRLWKTTFRRRSGRRWSRGLRRR